MKRLLGIFMMVCRIIVALTLVSIALKYQIDKVFLFATAFMVLVDGLTWTVTL